ncbi:MAG TPA: hypothetical protein DDW54_02710 [Clostridiales bacterium]|nr:hypothetical protein [Clostridiales bacterium]
MDRKSVWSEIGEKTGSEYYENFPLACKCTYGTGGKADCFFTPDCAEKAISLVKELKDRGIPYVFLGAGSNVLISDDGYRGAVVSSEKLKGISVKADLVTAGAGEKLENLVRQSLYNSLGGIEFLSGIPASVGGAVAMNAGCFGKNAGDFVSYVVSTDGIKSRADCGFDYRTSVFKREKIGIIAVCFALENVEFEQSESKVEYFRGLRRNKHPKGRSCGSVFKNDGYFAGKIIESCGLKGFRIGGAKISEKHANFIVADENATSADVFGLINYAKKKAEEICGVKLTEEVEYIGEF